SSKVSLRQKHVWGETYAGHPRGADVALRVLSSLDANALIHKERLVEVLHREIRSKLGPRSEILELRLPSRFLAAGIVPRNQKSLRVMEAELWNRGIRVGLESDALLIVPMYT